MHRNGLTGMGFMHNKATYGTKRIRNKNYCFHKQKNITKDKKNDMAIRNIPTIEETLAMMTDLYNECYSNLTTKEKTAGREMGLVAKSPKESKFIIRLLDETYQIQDTRKIALRVSRLLNKYGMPKHISLSHKLFFYVFKMVGFISPLCYLMVPILKKALRKATNVLVIDADTNLLRKDKEKADKMGISYESCLMGERAIGMKEANSMFAECIKTLKNPNVSRLAVKLTSIYPQIHDIEHKDGETELERRLAELYRVAMQHPIRNDKGMTVYKVVMIDTEAYGDVAYTISIFKKVLSQPEFLKYTAGITLQAYLLDAWDIQTELLEFAKQRQDNGGAPLEMRLVKGRASMMENILCEKRGWESPVRTDKKDVDANYMHILERAMMMENAKALRIGIATHNLYSIAYAYLLSRKMNTPKRCFRFEMLEGIANHVIRTLNKRDVQVLVHVPMVANAEYNRAVAYIARRLYDNFSNDTFISKSYMLKPQTAVWDKLAESFKESYIRKDKLEHRKAHRQDRNEYYGNICSYQEFVNEADTDFRLECNQRWAEKIIKKWKTDGTMTGNKCDWRKWVPGDTLPSQVGDKLFYNDKKQKYYDISQDGTVEVCEMSITDPVQMERVLLAAKNDKSGWRQTELNKRMEILLKAANNIGMMRAEMVGAICAIAGVTVEQADAEVSEAMNYCRLYTYLYKNLANLEDVSLTAKGVVLILTPRIFSSSISSNYIASALITGNSCVVKPSTKTAPVIWLMANAFWNAGVPKDALQVNITEPSYYKLLTSSPFINHICLTGKSETADSISQINPKKSFQAETNSKNAIILTAKGDMYQAIKNTCISAFISAGQSCAACSILLVERCIYDNPVFKNALIDCAQTMMVGSIWNMCNQYGPLTTNKDKKLMRALNLEDGETWLVAPEFLDEEKRYMKPAIKYNVKPDSYTFHTKLNAPLLAVTPYDQLKDAIRIINEQDYGFTTGLFSLDENEQNYWRNNVIAGNLMINRDISILKAYMQPIGGFKNSSHGSEFKIAGPNFCLQMVEAKDKDGSTTDYKQSYAEWYEKEFKVKHNLSPKMTGELNLMYYLPIKTGMVLRLFGDESAEDIDMVLTAAKTVGTNLTISIDGNNKVLKNMKPAHVVKETLGDFYDHMNEYKRIRTISNNVPDALFAIAANLNKNVIPFKPVRNGRIELAYYVTEQSLSHSYNRYGIEIDVPEI